ncbi:DUF4136 domain-containing protein [Thioalkalivibrio sp. XN8]|uniref:DUF4136 domain-containing protein n=1 Tax=Thioalkalivibrio sp. XN8 TaxID=2712863 RepID=UPI0013E99F5E|nr:DUF4136 domain-containing protein [Thioalkalivibrio sp. XN8]NGP52614.1 DUF4136 domain-containing protein [Thioalkalivibrio sp. XN8]
MSKKTARAVALAAMLAFLAGCAAMAPRVTTDYDRSVDFSQYRTFAFMDREERGVARSYDSIADRRLMAAVSRELEARGYRQVEADPDLLVNFAVATETVEEIVSVPSPGWPAPWGWRYYYYPWPAYNYDTYVDRYEQGTIFIDLVDAERRQLVWEGRAVQRVNSATREDPAGTLDATVSEIFAAYPFRAGPAPR